MLITFSGLDGAGKSTQIELLKTYMEKDGVYVKLLTMYDDISTARVLRKLLRPIFRENKPSLKGEKVVNGAKLSFRNDKNRNPHVARFLVYIFDLLVLWVKAAYYRYFRKDALIMDRYIYDSLVNLLSVKPYSRFLRLYSQILVWLTPKPDYALLLDVVPEDAFMRKPEYSLSYMKKRGEAYRLFWNDFLSFGLVIPQGTKDAVFNSVLACVNINTLRESEKQ